MGLSDITHLGVMLDFHLVKFDSVVFHSVPITVVKGRENTVQTLYRGAPSGHFETGESFMLDRRQNQAHRREYARRWRHENLADVAVFGKTPAMYRSGAAESKQALIDAGLDIAFVTVKGRRGGSAMASAAVNAVLLAEAEAES